MHIADALISPAVGGTMWLAAAGLLGYASKKISQENDERTIPLMGVVGAFIFAVQMINFSIPGTGSSGHLGGGMILAVLLGPHAAFLTMASILTVQALFFADGGLLALGCNIVNLSFFPCFIAYPLIYKRIAGRTVTPTRIVIGSLISAVVAIQLGALGVVFETILSGRSELSLRTFLLMMQSIHFVISIVEGIATAAIISFIWKARPEILSAVSEGYLKGKHSTKPVVIVFCIVAMIMACFLSWFASTHPDGLEWALLKASSEKELSPPGKSLHTPFAEIQNKTALLPDYNFKTKETQTAAPGKLNPATRTGTTVSGLIGGLLTFCVVLLIGSILKIAVTRKNAYDGKN